MSTRPEYPKRWQRGDVVYLGRTELVVVGSGPKWLRIVPATKFGGDHEAHYTRWVWREDMQEGVPARRVGSRHRLATPEQHKYDEWVAHATDTLRAAGIYVERGSSWDTDAARALLAAFIEGPADA